MKRQTGEMTLTAMLFALAMVLSIVEGMFPVPAMIPGIKYGLANIVVMYCLLFLGIKKAGMIVVLKAVFAVISRGTIAGIMSLAGGMCSLLMMLLLKKVSKENYSYMLISIIGAISHNLGQMIMITILYSNNYLWTYFPFLLVTGIVMGILTAVLLKYLTPSFKRFGWIINK